MKKLISFIIALTLLLSLAAVPAHAAVTEDEGIISLLKEFEIIQGDENGDMMLDRKVSRAEFAKIAIAASPEKNSVAMGLRQSPFRDVPYTQWYAPYVKAAVSAGYIVGYLDATFRPENTVTYEEAATIMLRVLGYDDTTFGDAYPYGQLSKANSLSILDDIDATTGDELTRRQVMRMIYNGLKANTSTASELISVHDCTSIDNVDVIAVSDHQNNLGSDEILTSSGTYTTGEYFNENSVGMTGTVFIKDNKDIIAFVPDTESSYIDYDTYFVYSVLSNETIVGYKNGKFEKIDIPKNTTYYDDYYGTKLSDENQPLATKLYMGDILYVKRKDNGVVDYITYSHHELNGPIKVTGDNWISQLGASNLSKVFRDGSESGISSISTNDIVYYSEPIDVVFVYTDKITGIYESAKPNKDTPESVTISGKEYKVESVEAFKDLSSSGSFKYGDTVTLLLGRTGEVAGVAGSGSASASTSSTASASSASGGGYVIETGKKDFTNADSSVYSSYYVKVASPDGTVSEYQTANDCKSMLCSVVRVTFKNGKASLSRISSGGVSGAVNAAKGIIGSASVADDVKIIDTEGSSNTDTPAYCRVYLQRLDGVNLNASSVLYSSKNSAGEIDELILRDVTGDTYTYGLILSRDKATSAYKIDIDGTVNTHMTNFTSSATGPHRLKMVNGSVQKIQLIGSYPSSITSLSRTEAVIGSKAYLLSDNVVVYRKTDVSTYMKIPLDDAINGDYKMTAYYDKAQSSGGRIRIIIAQ